MGCPNPCRLSHHVCGYGEYAMVSVSASFITGMIAMLFYFKSRRWGAICALAKKQEYPPLITDLPDS